MAFDARDGYGIDNASLLGLSSCVPCGSAGEQQTRGRAFEPGDRDLHLMDLSGEASDTVIEPVDACSES